jgi:hypothetical protein
MCLTHQADLELLNEITSCLGGRIRSGFRRRSTKSYRSYPKEDKKEFASLRLPTQEPQEGDNSVIKIAHEEGRISGPLRLVRALNRLHFYG